MIGWGSKFQNLPTTTVLRKLNVHIISRDECLRIMPDIAEVHEFQLCTFDNKGFGTCLVIRILFTVILSFFSRITFDCLIGKIFVSA